MERFPLSKTEYGMYVEQVSSGSTAYNNPLSIKLPEGVDIERLKAAIYSVIAAHPYLKTGFGTDENGEVYKFIRECGVEIPVIEKERFDISEFIRPFAS